jgi:hypothetical protein
VGKHDRVECTAAAEIEFHPPERAGHFDTVAGNFLDRDRFRAGGAKIRETAAGSRRKGAERQSDQNTTAAGTAKS